MGAREDFSQAIERGDFVSAADIFSQNQLPSDADVSGFEASLLSNLNSFEHRIGEAIFSAQGEYQYLGEAGNNGARLAFLPASGTLDQMVQFANVTELRSHLELESLSQAEKDAIVSFYALSERAGLNLVQDEQATVRDGELSRSIVINYQGLTDVPRDGLSEVLARDTVRDDLLAIRQIRNADVRLFAAGTMNAKAESQKHYKVELSRQDPEIAAEVQAAGDVERRRAEQTQVASLAPSLASQNDDLSGSQGVSNGPRIISGADALRAMLIERGDSPEAVEMGVKVGLELFKTDRAYAGSLLAFGGAPYEHDPSNNSSYYVKLGTPGGEKTIWGVELDSAIEEGGLKIGDDAVISYQGQKPVVVKGKERDKDGNLTGRTIDIDAVKNTWDARPLEKLREAAALRLQEESSQAIEKGTDSVAAAVEPSEVEHDVSQSSRKKDESEDTIQNALPVGAAGQTGEQDAISHAPRNEDDAITRAPTAKEIAAAAAAAKEKTGPATLLNGRFVLRENGEYFRVDEGIESKRVALVDEVNKIRFVDKQMDAFQAAIELAKYKQWEAILVTGSEKFRAEAWHHARMAGLEVVGYEPTEKELTSLKAAQGNRAQLTAPDKEAQAALLDKSKSLENARKFALDDGFAVGPINLDSGRYAGKVLHETTHHVVQDSGKKIAAIHDKADFDQSSLKNALKQGVSLRIQYEKGRAALDAGKDRTQSRGR